jgi:hypothetical protein
MAATERKNHHLDRYPAARRRRPLGPVEVRGGEPEKAQVTLCTPTIGPPRSFARVHGMGPRIEDRSVLEIETGARLRARGSWGVDRAAVPSYVPLATQPVSQAVSPCSEVVSKDLTSRHVNHSSTSADHSETTRARRT